jgi:hypothetical protein
MRAQLRRSIRLRRSICRWLLSVAAVDGCRFDGCCLGCRLSVAINYDAALVAAVGLLLSVCCRSIERLGKSLSSMKSEESSDGCGCRLQAVGRCRPSAVAAVGGCREERLGQSISWKTMSRRPFFCRLLLSVLLSVAAVGAAVDGCRSMAVASVAVASVAGCSVAGGGLQAVRLQAVVRLQVTGCRRLQAVAGGCRSMAVRSQAVVRLQAVGCRLSVAGCRLQAVRSMAVRLQAVGCRLSFDCRLKLSVAGSNFRCSCRWGVAF